MEESICCFIPSKKHTGEVKTLRFVYETECETLKQPFLYPVHYLTLVTGGKGVLHIFGREYTLKQGSLFFSFPAVPFSIELCEGIKYCYISFMGAGVPSLLESVDVSFQNPVFQGFEQLSAFWLGAVARVDAENADLISQGVLMYTLSFLRKPGVPLQMNRMGEGLIKTVVDYVDENFRKTELSLKMLAEEFSYTEKYLSRLFKQEMSVGFNQYLNNLRIQYASELMQQKPYAVAEVASVCGYSDAAYFSRTFKKRTGFSPTEYYRRQMEQREEQ